MKNGYFACVPRQGDLTTKEQFGDMQLHAEAASPLPTEAASQKAAIDEMADRWRTAGSTHIRRHGSEEPPMLQNQNTKVRYRNIWVRKLTAYDSGKAET